MIARAPAPVAELLRPYLEAVGPHEAEGSTLFFIGPDEAVFDKTLEAVKVGKIASKDKLRDTVTVELPTSLKDEKTTAEAGAKSSEAGAKPNDKAPKNDRPRAE